MAASPLKSARPCRPSWLLPLFAASLAALSPGAAAARTWHVPGDAPTIQAAIDLAQPGDDVLVAPGTYIEHDVTMKAAVWVHSAGGSGVTTVDASAAGPVFVCRGVQQETSLTGFTMTRGSADGVHDDGYGGGVLCVDSDLVVRDCVVSGSTAEFSGGGLYALTSHVTMEDCRIENCSSGHEGGGIYAEGTSLDLSDCAIVGNQGVSGGGIGAIGPEIRMARCVVSGNVAVNGGAGGIGCISPQLSIQDCLIAQNRAYGGFGGGGVGIEYCTGTIEGCTVADNGGVPGPGGVSVGYGSTIGITRTIIASNDGRGLSCYFQGTTVEVECVDLFDNTGGNELCGSDLGGNFSADPLFCDAPNGDYTLDANSPCLPGNHPDGIDCGLIGARGQGCGSTPTRPTTWGRIKAGFRDAR